VIYIKGEEDYKEECNDINIDLIDEDGQIYSVGDIIPSTPISWLFISFWVTTGLFAILGVTAVLMNIQLIG